MIRKQVAQKYINRVQAKKSLDERKPEFTYTPDVTDDVFVTIRPKETQQNGWCMNYYKFLDLLLLDALNCHVILAFIEIVDFSIYICQNIGENLTFQKWEIRKCSMLHGIKISTCCGIVSCTLYVCLWWLLNKTLFFLFLETLVKFTTLKSLWKSMFRFHFGLNSVKLNTSLRNFKPSF